MPRLIDPHPSLMRSLSNASTCAASVESAPSDCVEVENKQRNGINRMTSSKSTKSTTESDSSSLALSKTQSASKKSFFGRLMGGTGEW